MSMSVGILRDIPKNRLETTFVVVPEIMFWIDEQKSSVADLSILIYHLSLMGFTLRTNSCPVIWSIAAFRLRGSDTASGTFETITVACESSTEADLGNWGKLNS